MEKYAVFCLQLLSILNTGRGGKGSKCTATESKENPPIKANTLNPMNPFILILTHLCIFWGKKINMFFYKYRATLCRNNKRTCLNFCRSFRAEPGKGCFRLIALSLILFFAPSILSATCLNSSLGYSSTFRLAGLRCKAKGSM